MENQEDLMMEENEDTSNVDFSFLKRRQQRREKRQKDYAGTLKWQTLRHMDKAYFANREIRNALKDIVTRHYMNGGYEDDILLEEPTLSVSQTLTDISAHQLFDEEDYHSSLIFYGEEGSQNLYRRADEEILQLLEEMATFAETEKEEANLHLLRKFAKDGALLFNFRREYIITSEEVDEWLKHHQECKRALFALTLFGE